MKVIFFPYCQVVHDQVINIKKFQIDFLKILKMNICFGSYFWKIILIKTWNLLMSLIKHRDMTKKFLVFVSTSFSPYVLPGMEYQKHMLVSYFWIYPGWGKDNRAFLSSYQWVYITMFSGDHVMPKTSGSGDTF